VHLLLDLFSSATSNWSIRAGDNVGEVTGVVAEEVDVVDAGVVISEAEPRRRVRGSGEERREARARRGGRGRRSRAWAVARWSGGTGVGVGREWRGREGVSGVN
jgi:hypothetical protein